MSRTDKPRYPSREESLQVLKACSPEDFDGHSGFREMSLEQRIEWASRTALVIWEAKQKRDASVRDKCTDND